MAFTLPRQTAGARIAFAIAAAAAALGTTAATAAPPASGPTFVAAQLTIAAGTGGPEAAVAPGGLTCSWRETGLQATQLILYQCDAAVVGAVEGCVYKNKLVAGSPMQLSIFRNPQTMLEGGPVGLVSNTVGKINGTTTTAVPVSEGHGGELCTEPALPQVVAVRWCNAALADTVNGLVGATASELFRQFFSGAAPVPSCAELLAGP